MRKRAIYKALSDGQKKAFDGSVQKWIDICQFRGVDDRRSNCPLCKTYRVLSHNRCADEGGLECPISAVAMNGCRLTPYVNWSYHHSTLLSHGPPFFVDSKHSLELAKEELRYLAEFLPAKHELHKEITVALATVWSLETIIGTAKAIIVSEVREKLDE